MRLGKIEVKRRVWVGMIFALTAVGVWWVWTNATRPHLESRAQPRQPFVRLAGSGRSTDDQVLRERAEYFDPTPLFFPTEWNYGQGRSLAATRHEPDQVFGSFDPNLQFADQYFKARRSNSASVPERLVDVVAQGNERPLSGLGHIDRPSSGLEDRSGFLEVSSLADGKIIMAHAITELALPPSDYRPAEFLAVVSSSGLVGDPSLINGSGSEEWDASLRAYLVKSFRLGERLDPGRYRVLIGP